MPEQQVRAERPNIIYILTDDQGPWAAGCYGNHEMRTPNIDRLAETGISGSQHELPQPLHSGHTLARLSEGVGLPNLPH